MIEYPSIIASSKAPRGPMIAFDKLDGSNIRVKYTQKKGFHLFGSRTQMFDHSHPFLAPAIPYFKKHFETPLTKLIEKNYPNEREVIAFFEFFGDQSFAGFHEPGDPTHRLVCIDIMVGHKNRKFLSPQQFIKETTKFNVEIPAVLYEGNLSDQFINDVRGGKFDVVEGVVCKGTLSSGAARGGIWMCKVKTQAYLDRLFNRYGEEGLERFGE
jgi:hypothetical protein